MTTRLDLSSMLANNAVAVTPSDSTVVAFNGLYIGVAGDVAVKGQNGVAVTFKNVPVGFFPMNVVAVMLTNTTATNILGLSQ